MLCEQGYSSSLAAARLQQLGFAGATDVIGGFEPGGQQGFRPFTGRGIGTPVTLHGRKPGDIGAAT